MREETLRDLIYNADLDKKVNDYNVDSNITLLEFYQYYMSSGKKRTEIAYYIDFLIIVYNNTRVGIIYNMDNKDLHFYIKEEFRNLGIMSNIMKSGLLKTIWPKLKEYNTISCTIPSSYFKIKHLASLGGFELLGPDNEGDIYYRSEYDKKLVKIEEITNENMRNRASLYRRMIKIFESLGISFQFLRLRDMKEHALFISGKYGLTRLISFDSVVLFKDEKKNKWVPVIFKVSYYKYGSIDQKLDYFIEGDEMRKILKKMKDWLDGKF